MGGQNPFFALPIIRGEFVIFFIFVKNMKESRNREKERKIHRKGSKFWMKGVHFWKKLSTTKKRSSEICENRRKKIWECCPKIFSENFCPPIFVTQIFAPNIYDKSTPLFITIDAFFCPWMLNLPQRNFVLFSIIWIPKYWNATLQQNVQLLQARMLCILRQKTDCVKIGRHGNGGKPWQLLKQTMFAVWTTSA